MFEYLLQVPANRAGYKTFSPGQLTMIQQVVSLAIFVPLAAVGMWQPLRREFVCAGPCLMGAVRFMFRRAAAPPH